MPPQFPLLELPFLAELTALRRDIHAHPELAFAENRTADIVARELARYGLEVHRGTGQNRRRRRAACRHLAAHDRPACRHGCAAALRK
jgi:metal-dependent amidase/aminoacylase/carboxypeptidase family protein